MARPTTRPVKAVEEASFGWRLRKALDQKALDQPDYGWSVNALAKHLKDRGAEGTVNGQAIGEYLRNEKHPRRDVLVALAEVLGVRVAWLAFGDGPMLDDDYSLHSTPLYLIKASEDARGNPTEAREDFLRGLGQEMDREYMRFDPFERVAVGFVLARWIEWKLKPAKRTAHARGVLAEEILKKLATFIKAFALNWDTREGLSGSRARVRARRGSRVWKTHFVQGIASLLLAGERDDAEALEKP